MNRLFCSRFQRSHLRWMLVIVACTSWSVARGQQVDPPAGGRVDIYGDPLPPGAVARLGTLRFRSTIESTQSLEFIPGDHRFVAPSRSGGVGIWDSQTGEILHDLKLPAYMLADFDVSPDGTRIATLARQFQTQKKLAKQLQPQTREERGWLQIWFTGTGGPDREIRWVDEPRTASTTLAFSPNSRSIAVGTREGTIRVYDLESRQEVLSYQAIKGEIESIAFSPDGELIAAASRQGVSLWPWLSGKEPRLLLTMDEGSRGASYVTFSPDGKWLATASDERGGIRVWEVATQKVKWRTGGEQWHYAGRMEFTGDSQSLVVLNRNPQHSADVHWLAAETGKSMRTIELGVIARNVAISSDQELIAIHGGTSAIHILRTDSKPTDTSKFVGHTEHVSQVAFTADGSQVASACYRSDVLVWDARTGQPAGAINNGKNYVTSLAISFDGKSLATAAFDEKTRVFDFKTGKPIYSFLGHARQGYYRANIVSFTPDGRLLSFGPDMFLRIWNLANGKAIAEHDIAAALRVTRMADGELSKSDDPFGDEMEGRSISRAIFSEDGRLLVLHRGRELITVDVASGKEIRRLAAKVAPFDVSPNGERIATVETIREGKEVAHYASVITVRDLVSDGVLCEISGIPGSAYEIRFAPDGKSLAASISIREDNRSYRYFISHYDVATGKELFRINSPERAISLAFSPDGSQLVAGYSDTTAIVWNLAHFRE